ncbi:MAG: hypothetical protein HZA04_07760 [Nitrospinae bacterium]|nr:hypothetical protein [Nitrospinota bacterium]
MQKRIDPRENPLSCRYVNVEMTYPRTRSTIETFLWHIYHENSKVYISRKGEWHLLVPSRCSQLTTDNRCRLKHQLEQCAQHTYPGAKKIEDVARFVFHNEDELLRYLKEHRPAIFKKMPLATRRVIGD